MTPAVLCTATAAARAAVFLDDAAADDRELEPPHPAFVGFRRMTYIWVDGDALLPIGDRVRMWLDFLRERGVRSAWLRAVDAGFAVCAAGPRGSDTWVVDGDAVQLTMRGVSGSAAMPAGDIEAAGHALRAALQVATARVADSMRRAELQRALAILDSSDDGSEASDVAWPFFILPARGYSTMARRLLGAAAAGWPADLTSDDELARMARAALLAAVNEPHQAPPPA